MTSDKGDSRFVGPCIQRGEIGEAVLEAIQEDNRDREISVEEHASYLRIQVQGECLIMFATVGEMLGRHVTRADIECNMPAFEGFIRVESDCMRFLSK